MAACHVIRNKKPSMPHSRLLCSLVLSRLRCVVRSSYLLSPATRSKMGICLPLVAALHLIIRPIAHSIFSLAIAWLVGLFWLF